MIDLENLIYERAEAILSSDDGLYAEYDIVERDGSSWGIIAVLDDEGIRRYEFIETEISWMRPEAIDEYNEIADDDIPVAVIVPDEAFLALSERVRKYGSRDIAVLGYEAILAGKNVLPAL